MTTEEEEATVVVDLEEGGDAIEHVPINNTQGDSNESNSTCLICLEEWTIGGDHRLCCLKCGHLYGRSCIEKWIRDSAAPARCPSCNKNTKKVDLRDLWCKAIRAIDNTEVSRLQQLLESERKLRKTDSAVIFHQNLKIELLHKDLDKLKKDIIVKDARIAKLESLVERYSKSYAQKLAHDNQEGRMQDFAPIDLKELEDNFDSDFEVEPRELKGMFHFAKNIEISPIAGCKGFAMCPTSYMLILAQPTPRNSRNIFGNFGLRKYSTIDTNCREFIPLHGKEINSIDLKPFGDLILTSSRDKTIKLTSVNNNTSVNTYHCAYDPSCVSWSSHREQQFYVASNNCFISLYDIRNTSEYIYQTEHRIASSGSISIASASSDDLNGLLVNDLKGSQFVEVSDSSHYDSLTIDSSTDHLVCHSLPFEGLMGTVDFCKRSSLALITTRRSSRSPNVTHNLIKLHRAQTGEEPNKVECQRVRTFMGGQPGELLNYSRILKHPTLPESVLVGACDQDARGIKLWDSADNTEFQTIKTNDWIRDMIMYSPENSNQHVLYTLSNKGVGVYRWDYA